MHIHTPSTRMHTHIQRERIIIINRLNITLVTKILLT